jgi:hypothetical protein
MKKPMNPSRRPNKGRLVGVVAGVIMLALGTSAAVCLRGGETKNSAAPPTSGKQAANPVPAGPTTRSGSFVQSNQIRPLTQEEALKLAEGIKQLVNKSTDGLVSARHPDGTVSMDLQGRFQNIALAKKNDDGSVSQACVDTPESAARFFEIDPQLVQDQTPLKRSQINKQNP